MLNLKPNAGCKEILFWKLIHAILFCIFFQVVCLVLFLLLVNFSLLSPLLWIKSTASILTSLNTWLLLVPLATIIFTQGIVYSKDYILQSTYRSSRIAKYLSIFTLRNLISFTSHILISVLTVWLYLTLLGGKYNTIYKPCKENYTCLVEETFFMILNGIWIGFYYFLREYLNNDRSIQFPVIQQKKFLMIKLTVASTLKQAAKEAFWPTVYFVILYYFRGLRSRDWFVENLSLQLEEEIHVFDVLRNNFLYAWLFSSLFIFSILTMKLFLEVFLTEHLPFPIDFESPGVLNLKEALVMQNLPIIQHLACFDVYKLSLWDPARRQVLFSLSQPGGHPHNWNNTLEAILKVISDYSSQLNKATEAILSANSAGKVKETAKEETPKVVQDVTHGVFLTNTVASPGSIRNMSLPRFDNVPTPTVPQPDLPNAIERLWDGMVNKMEQVLATIKKKSGIDYFFGEQPENRLYFLLSNSQPIIWLVQGTSFLTSSSFIEDSYGVVQKDLPVIITSLIQFKQSVDKLNKVNLSSRKNNRADNMKIQTRTALRTAARRCLYNICNTFGEYLPQLHLNKDILLQLQPFILYKEG